MPHLFTSTPPYCILIANQADPTNPGYDAHDWAGAWSTLTGGPTTNADALHCHTGGGSLWEDTTGQIQPITSGCDIVPKGTACVGIALNRWDGWFGVVNASGCVESGNIYVTTGAANGCFACSDASGKIVWTSPPAGSSLWDDTTDPYICPASSCYVRADCFVAVSGGTGTVTADLVGIGMSSTCPLAVTGNALITGTLKVSDQLYACECLTVTCDIFVDRWIEVGSCVSIGIAPVCPLTVSGGSYLAGTTEAQNILPTSTESYDLGTSTCLWDKIYGRSIISACVTASTCINLNGYAITASGAKTLATIEYEPNKYAQLKVEESPETVFNDHGNVKVIKDNPCCIKFDCVFNKVTEDGTDYNLQITPNSNVVQNVWNVVKKEDGFVITSTEDSNFDWYVRKFRRFRRNDRWLKDGKGFNPDEFTENEMNTMESYPEYIKQIKNQNKVIQNVW